MTNEASISVAGYVATEPDLTTTQTGTSMLKMRVAWTPRRFDRETSQWLDQPTCFVWVKCWRRLAENVEFSMHKGDPIVVSGTLTISEYLSKEGDRRMSVDINATAVGHDLSRGVTRFRRQRPEKDPSAREGQSGEEESGEPRSDRPEARGAATDAADFGAADAGPADPSAGDLDHEDLAARHLELVDADLARSHIAGDGPEDEDELESASTG
jgi:single-strand DNA-binding protein